MRKQKLRDRLKTELPRTINKKMFIKAIGVNNPILNDREHSLNYFAQQFVEMDISTEAKEFWAYLIKATTKQIKKENDGSN